jgi:hypothetical protein
MHVYGLICMYFGAFCIGGIGGYVLGKLLARAYFWLVDY